MKDHWIVRNVEDVAPVACPCGEARRVITADDGAPVSIHRTVITRSAQKHYHKKAAEHYVVLQGTGEMELGNARVAVRPGDMIFIPPLTPHVARGEFVIINVVCPPLDPSDEYLVP
ncbi:MAG: cupin domain-containing protein [Kiritimatiellae bacterium]|nr:cupin domain-containing protein [Kiritimatiellia bacterium]